MIFVFENNPDGRRARTARKWFADNGPPDLQPLPLGYDERERLKHGGADHILAWYARSLDGENYDVVRHPPFEDYACGVMASEFAPDFIKKDEQCKSASHRESSQEWDPASAGCDLKCTPKRCLRTGAVRLVRPSEIKRPIPN